MLSASPKHRSCTHPFSLSVICQYNHRSSRFQKAQPPLMLFNKSSKDPSRLFPKSHESLLTTMSFVQKERGHIKHKTFRPPPVFFVLFLLLGSHCCMAFHSLLGSITPTDYAALVHCHWSRLIHSDSDAGLPRIRD